MPPKDWPAPPRVADALDTPEPLGDEISWSGVSAGGDASFSGAAAGYEIVGSRLNGVRFTGAVLEGGRWIDVVVEDCELSGTMLQETTLVRVAFRKCRMSGLVAIAVKAQDVSFADCKIDGANFRGAALERCAYDGCDLTKADFYGATVTPGALRGCTLAGVDFSKAKCDGLDLRWSKVEGVVGAASLRRAIITPEQAVPLGLALLADLGVSIDDGDER